MTTKQLTPPERTEDWVFWLTTLPAERQAAARQVLLERLLAQGAANPAEAAAVIELILRPPNPAPQRTRPRRRS